MLFRSYNAHDMLDACKRAKLAYDEPKKWNKIISRAMNEDFSWSNSAELYIGLYHEMISWNE